MAAPQIDKELQPLVVGLMTLEKSPCHTVDKWYGDQYLATTKQLATLSQMEAEVPEIVWHHLSDADKRLKDHQCAEMPIQAVEMALQI